MARSRAEVLKSSTARDFGGGWNVVDSDLNLTSKFARVLKNMYRAPDASLQIRWGTTQHADLNSLFEAGAYPIGVQYYNAKLVVVSSKGDIVTIAGDGTKTKIFPVTGKNWNDAELATFAQFKGELIIANGVDKPLKIERDFSIDWLQDATGSNVNTPIAQFVIALSRFVVFAGDPAHPDRLHISARDAGGTFYGDPDPNDATFVDLGAYVDTDYYINSLAVFRGKLVVGFSDGVLTGNLGTYSGAIHSPTFDDFIPGVGSLSHGAIQTFGDDVLYLDLFGVPQLSRTMFTQSIRPGRASQLIDPEIQAALNNLTTYGAIRSRVFSVYNQQEGQYMLFIPDANAPEDITATKCFVYTNIPQMDVKAWSLFDGWNFACGCRSAEGRIFFVGYNNKVYLYGNKSDPSYADFIGDTAANADGSGVDIAFDWEMPWADFGKRMNVKKTYHIGFDTKGAAKFTAEFYVDNFIEDANGDDTPVLSLEFVGGDSDGYGGVRENAETPYGAGRRAVDERLWAWVAKFKLAKLRIHGSTKLPLKFIAVSMTYQIGSIRR